MKKTILSLSLIAISMAFSAEAENNLNMGEDIFNENIIDGNNFVNDNLALTPKQKARIDIAKRKQREAEEEVERTQQI